MIKEFAENLKNLRNKKGLTQTQLAERLWLNKSIISAYENQQRMPSLDVLIKLSYEFNVSMEYLLGLSKENTIDITGLKDDQVSIIAQLIAEFKKNNK